jgi:hypothetical protein
MELCRLDQNNKKKWCRTLKVDFQNNKKIGLKINQLDSFMIKINCVVDANNWTTLSIQAKTVNSARYISAIIKNERTASQ